MKRNSAPKWLGKVAKSYYLKTYKDNPHVEDLESLAQLADYYETWRTARDVIGEILNDPERDQELTKFRGLMKDALAAQNALTKRLGVYPAKSNEAEDEEDDLELDLEDEGEE